MNKMETFFRAYEFLVNEAEILDNELYNQWLEMLSDDFEYLITYNETRSKISDSFFLKANRKKMSEMIKRLYNPAGWALQQSSSKFRRIIGNIKVLDVLGKEVRVKSNLVIFRVETNEHGNQTYLTCERNDVLEMKDEIKLKSRVVILDSPSLVTYNLYFPL